MRVSRVAAAWVVLGVLGVFGAAARAEEIPVVVELADGTQVAGTVDAGLELTLVADGQPTRVPLRDLRWLAISVVRAEEGASLAAEVQRQRVRLADPDPQVREAGSAALAALPGAAGQALRELADHDPDPEVVERAEAALVALRARGDLADPRDLVWLPSGVTRGWLTLLRLELTSALGPLTLERSEIRAIRGAQVEDAELAEALGEAWLPPQVRVRVLPPLQVVVGLRDGGRVVGLIPLDRLALRDTDGRSVDPEGLQQLTRERDGDAPGVFRLERAGQPAARVSFTSASLPVAGAAREWTIPIEAIESLTVGPPPPSDGSLVALVRAFQRAGAAGGPPPRQRFWVHINDQPANPWNSQAGTGLTWSLLEVKGQAALVGADAQSNAYAGDTPGDTRLPILCVRQRQLPVPEGLGEGDFYRGWSGCELRLSKPVAGAELTSLAAATARIKAELGPDWEMAEFHAPHGGGWHWWGWWTQPSGK